MRACVPTVYRSTTQYGNKLSVLVYIMPAINKYSSSWRRKIAQYIVRRAALTPSIRFLPQLLVIQILYKRILDPPCAASDTIMSGLLDARRSPNRIITVIVQVGKSGPIHYVQMGSRLHVNVTFLPTLQDLDGGKFVCR